MTRTEIVELADALNVAHSMLFTIQKGGSFDSAARLERMQKIERALGLTAERRIVVDYSSIDGGHTRRTFKSVRGARSFAHKWVGEDADLGSHYAVSSDGIGKVTVAGASLAELFPGR